MDEDRQSDLLSSKISRIGQDQDVVALLHERSGMAGLENNKISCVTYPWVVCFLDILFLCGVRFLLLHSVLRKSISKL